MTPIKVGEFRPNRLRRPMSIWQRLVARAFHRLYYNSWKRGHRRGPSPATLSLHFLGHQMIKCPFDLWVYQELVVEQQPDWVIECGTFRGGTALYFAVLMDAIGHGGVIAIDTTPYDGRPEHSRIRYVHGSSTAAETIAELRRIVGPQDRCLVILDSDHSEQHVHAELLIYRDFVGVGGYLIVEDTNVNGHPIAPKHGPGPMEAVRAFLKEDPRFSADPAMERFLLTMNPSGYLRRVA